MDISSSVVLVVIGVAVVWTTMTYNNLVALIHSVSKAWANIDVMLKQRHDELPKLVETCKQYKQFEQETPATSHRDPLAGTARAREKRHSSAGTSGIDVTRRAGQYLRGNRGLP